MDAEGGTPTHLNQLHNHLRTLEQVLRQRFLALGVDAELGPRLGREAGSLLDELGDLLAVPLFCARPDGCLEYANRALLQLLGGEGVLGGEPRLQDLLPGWKQEETAAAPAACLLQTGGGSLPVRVRTRLLREGGNVVAVLGTVEDQSPHLRAMEALRQSEIRYHGLFEEALDAIFLMDGDQFVECNSAAGRMFGRPPEQLAGLRPLELSPPLQRDGRPSAEAARERIEAAHQGRRQHFEWLHSRHDGSTFDAEVSLSPLDLGGKRLLLAIVRDVTDRKYAEAALKASEEFNRGMIQHAPMGVMYVDPSGVLVYENPAMERMMGVPRDQAEQQLRQAQKLDAIGSLAGGLAHDFNNLLTGISGNAELALQHLDEAVEVRRLLQDQVQICQRASDLTRRLLAFSRQEELSPRPMLLQRLLDDLENMLRRLLGETIVLDWQSSGEAWAVRADPGQMEQVVLNLVVNARDAMPDGGTLSLRVRNIQLGAAQARRVMNLTPGPYVQLEVGDSGHGIEEDVQGRIFEPFFTTKALGKGTGLGLSIVYAIVKKCGGAVTVESRPGSGTRFRLFFPSLGPLAVRPPDAAPEPGELPRGHETILVLEDEPAVRDLSVRLLEHCGYHVLSAGSGAEALELAAGLETPPDLIFSDVIMPGMSGPAAVRRLLELWPRTRVLFCSGYTDGELSRHDLSPAKGAPLLGKPFTLDTLCRRVRQVLDGPAADAGVDTDAGQP